jgi:hypothetical protein
MWSSEADHAAAGSAHRLDKRLAVKCAHEQAIRIMVFHDTNTRVQAIGPARGGSGDRSGTLLSSAQGVEDLLLSHDQCIRTQVIHIYLPPLVALRQK